MSKLPKNEKMNISLDAARRSMPSLLTVEEIRQKFGPVQTLGAPNDIAIAQDGALQGAGVYTLLQHSMEMLGSYAYPEFLGYGYLTGLTQNPLIRVGAEMISDEMTRKWIKLVTTGDTSQRDADGKKLSELTAALKRHKIQKLCHDCLSLTSYYGGCLVYMDNGVPDSDLLTPLHLDAAVFRRGSLNGFKIVEPFNISPGLYSTSNPMAKNYFKPASWWIQGREVHKSHFLYFAANLPPTLLLPAYNFFGIPLAQIVLDPVLHFVECREAAARLLKKFSLTVFKTDMSSVLSGGATTMLERRIQLMVQGRDNDGVETIDNETEDIIKLETPLGGVTDIVKQAMEIVAAYFGEPAVKLWGISPGGFNATGESDIQNHYDHVASQQEKILREPLENILRVLQLDLFGEIDENITFEFEPLGKDDERTIADVNKIKADTSAIYFDRGIVSAEETRKVLAEDPQSGFNDIDPDAVPEDPEEGSVVELGDPQLGKEGEQYPKDEVGSI